MELRCNAKQSLYSCYNCKQCDLGLLAQTNHWNMISHVVNNNNMIGSFSSLTDSRKRTIHIITPWVRFRLAYASALTSPVTCVSNLKKIECSQITPIISWNNFLIRLEIFWIYKSLENVMYRWNSWELNFKTQRKQFLIIIKMMKSRLFCFKVYNNKNKIISLY